MPAVTLPQSRDGGVRQATSHPVARLLFWSLSRSIGSFDICKMHCEVVGKTTLLSYPANGIIAVLVSTGGSTQVRESQCLADSKLGNGR